ncbi:MAG: DNA/RNA non-specific endonuclease [Treponema sp.]|nr:DNA/RNA non-specific endonuclease [Treponema sp.]
MKEIHNDNVVEISQSKHQNSDFDPDKRVAVDNRPVNGNFTDEDKAAMERGIELYGNEDFKDSRIGDQWEDPEKGYLKPNIEYTAGENSYTYKTDNQGRIVHAEAVPLKEKPRDERIPHNSQSPDKVSGDDAGHIIGDQFGGSPDIDNIISQKSGLNRGEYKKLEGYLRNQIREGNKVEVLYDLKYEEESRRPEEISVTYRINNGDWNEQVFMNSSSDKVA